MSDWRLAVGVEKKGPNPMGRRRAMVLAWLLPVGLCCAEDQERNVYMTMSACAESSVVREEGVACSERLPLLGRTGLTCFFEKGAAPLVSFSHRDTDAGYAYRLSPGLFVDESVEDNEKEWARAEGKARSATYDYLNRCTAFEFKGTKTR